MTAEPLAALVSLFGLLLTFVLIIVLFLCIFPPASKSYRYRQMLSNLFVSGKIRQLAKKHDLDLAEEYECFRTCLKENRLKEMQLHDSIEEELQSSLDDELKAKDTKDTKKSK